MRKPRRVALVTAIMVRNDAISLAARDTIRALEDQGEFTARSFGCACEYPEIDHTHCCDPADLLLDPYYQTADAAIFHFGMYHPIFDALLGGMQERADRWVPRRARWRSCS